MTIEHDDTQEADSLLAAVARIPARPEGWTPPAELDEYKLVRPIGRGGMGSVWLAQDRLLDRLVAVKFIAHAEPDVNTRERFVVEARAAARLQHLNVVTVHRYGDLGGRPYLVSEYIRGEPLDKLAKPVSPERALELGVQLARGLAAAHRAGIVHRDIKPGNAILTADGDVKLVDFGLARIGRSEPTEGTSETTSALTEPGTVAGTPRYLAPEVRLGDPATPSSDVYGVGCVLYELVTGRAAVLDAREGVVPSLGERAGRLAPIIDRCLAFDAAERFSSGEELREAIERVAAPVFGGELPEGNPYRGLVPFEAEHRALFFGRGGEIRAVIDKLRAEPFVLVTGDSGVGKSSLCRAGVVPNILDRAFDDGRDWTVVQLVPGQRPLAALASQLAATIGLDEAAFVARLDEEPVMLARELRRVLGASRGIVLYIDQLEELVTLADREEAEQFSVALGHLIVRGPSLRVLATVRSDFLTRLSELPGLGGELARALYLLRPLDADAAREAIVGPARAKGGRFESDELVEELVTAVTGQDRIELPLLAFTLAQLWDARDADTQVISRASLDAIGGVRGALARHADHVLESLLPAQQAAARRLLLRLVTPDRTRARRSESELAAIDRGVVDALVRGRLVVAHGGDEPTYDLAHDRLIDGWPTLAAMLSQSAEAHAAHGRLASAVAEWQRLERRADALWGERQLAEVDRIPDDDLADHERAFVVASQRAVRRRRFVKRAVAVAVPIVLASIYVGAKLVAHRDLERKVASNVADADRQLSVASATDNAGAALENDAFAKFEAGDPLAEATWAHALERDDAARAAYGQAANTLDSALLLDPDNAGLLAKLASLTRARVALADRVHRRDERDALAARLAVYAPGSIVPTAQVAVSTQPNDAIVTLLDGSPVPSQLAPGSYVLVAHAPGRATVRVPISVRAGEQRRVTIALPDAGVVPPGFLYVPAGAFQYGCGDGETLRRYFPAMPLHERSVPAFLVGRTEVTYRQWIEFLDALPPAEREAHRPRNDNPNTVGAGGTVELRQVDGAWELAFAPDQRVYRARQGEPIVYGQRTRRASQDWLDFPISGISPNDVIAYAAWLDATKRVPHARLCTEAEWEYVARGVDGRPYPTGESIGPDDADFDATYGKLPDAFGPDVVGSHPASRSPLGADDMSGNVWEIVRTRNGFSTRGGCFYMDATTAHLANSQFVLPDTRHVQIGARICADL